MAERGVTQADFLQSTLLAREGFRHAFFTRRGGVSEGPFDSLSFSLAVGDRAEHVTENLRRAGAVLGVDAERIYYLSQVHGADVRFADGREHRERFLRREGDAVVSLAPDLGCGVRSADCVPILLADAASGAVAAVHAGWRGVVNRVAVACVAKLRELGASPDLVAAIGPHIEAEAFEVSDDVAAELSAASRAENAVDRRRAKPRVDLRRILRAQLEEAGIPAARIDDVRGCTFSDRDRFFSYRRDGKRSGRHLSAIVARG